MSDERPLEELSIFVTPEGGMTHVAVYSIYISSHRAAIPVATCASPELILSGEACYPPDSSMMDLDENEEVYSARKTPPTPDMSFSSSSTSVCRYST